MVRRLHVFCLCAAVLVPVTLQAQAPLGPAATLSQQANILFDQSSYADAIPVYERLLKDYPNSELAPDAQIHLAYGEFFTGAYQPAVDRLRKLLASPATAAELQELSGGLLPQVLSQQAGSFPLGDSKRKSTYEAAIREFSASLTKFPKSADAETALYGRAAAEYQVSRFADAERDTRQCIALYPRSENVDDSSFLLALTLGSEANLLVIGKSGEPTDPAALKNYEEARAILTAIAASKNDPALANEALYQLGATLMAQASTMPEAARGPLLNEALAAFRSVQPREAMIAAQNARVIRLRDLRIAEARKGAAADRALIRQVESRLTRERGKLASLQGKDDPVLTARLQCGAVYYQQARYDETRALINTLLPVATSPETEKVALYYSALSYAGQGNKEKAVAGYDKFQAKYAGDAVAENLPLVMGSLFMGGVSPDPARANKFFADFTRLYPKSNLRDVALLQQANTSVSLKRYDEALATIGRFLKTNPRRELAAAAELTRAEALKDKGEFIVALNAYRKVRDQFADRPEAEEAAFFIGWTDVQKHDIGGALAELKSFLAKYPNSKLTASALLAQSQAQLAQNAPDKALATIGNLLTRFPKSPEAVNAYFERANVFIAGKKFDDVVKTLTEFVDKYPDDPQTFAAYDRIAEIQLQQNNPAAAAGAYQHFVERQPNSPSAPLALSRLAELWLRAAQSMGSYIVLGAPQRAAWTKNLSDSVAAAEHLLDAYPEAPAAALGLQTLSDVQRLLADAKVKTPEQAHDYFETLAGKFEDRPAVRSRILFRVAAMNVDKDPAEALSEMQANYDAGVQYSPADLDAFGTLLLDADPNAAAQVFGKLDADYPVPPGVLPAQAPRDVQDAQAAVLYSRGKLAEAKGDEAGAARAFETLKKDFPRSAKAPQADLGIAQSLVKQGKPDLAVPLLAEIAKSTAAPAQTHAEGMMLMGKIQQDKGLVTALDTYLKIQAFYPTSTLAPEALWLGAQLLEKQAAALAATPAAPNAPTKASQLARARKAYETLVSKYPDSQRASEAKMRLTNAAQL